jgi:hypothetical protein
LRALGFPGRASIRQASTNAQAIVRAHATLVDYDEAKTARDWAKAADALNGCSSDDIRTRVALLTHVEKVEVYAAAPGYARPVFEAIGAADGDAAWLGAKRRGDWQMAAWWLNGFSNADIATRVSTLSAAEQTQLNTGAVAKLGPGATRITTALFNLSPVPGAIPSEDYVVPFDRNPLSAPGERIIMHGEFTHAHQADYQLVWTAVGGTFDSAGGATTKTIAGLHSGNLDFFVNSTWDGVSTVQVDLGVQRKSDFAMVRTYTWTFGRKTAIPTTITQTEAQTDQALPAAGAVYHYTLGPPIAPPGTDSYLHQTILERFGTMTSNIHLADLKPAWRSAHPGIATDADIVRHFFGDPGRNGTFTVSAGDRIADRHGGGLPPLADVQAALTTMMDVWVELPQTYEATPGVALGNFIIRRTLKTSGAMFVAKRSVP